MILGFEIRDYVCLAGALLLELSALFALVIFEIGSYFLPRSAWILILLFYGFRT
jgi:hypothetical protein